jgi:hypothetical protein
MKTPTTKGRWRPGQTGNPNGRPVGTGKVAQLRASIEAKIPEILESLVKSAVDGNVGAARILLDRCIAPLKPTDIEITLPLANQTLTMQGTEILNYMSSGVISPSQGAVFLNAISAQTKITEVDELRRRIDALESKHEVT